MDKPSEGVPVDEMTRILLEVSRGEKPAKPDTPEMAKLRAEFVKDVAEAKRKGHTIHIPGE